MCPSAMVDNSGVLYTINFYTFSYFQMAKYTPSSDGKSINSSKNRYYLYDEVTKAHGQSAPGYQDTGPYTGGHGNDWWWCIFLSHNILSPTIAQEVQTGNSDYIYICFLNPQQRWLNNIENNETEGLAMAKIRKSDLSLNGIRCVASCTSYYDSGGSCERWSPRLTHFGYLLQPEWGPCKAAFDGTYVHCFQIGNTSGIWNSDGQLTISQCLYYKRISASGFYVNSSSTISGMFDRDCNQCLMFPRFQKVDGNTYFCTSNGGDFVLGYWGSSPKQILYNGYQDYIRCNEQYASHARYPSDFCILKNGSQHVACFLGLKATGIYSDFSATYGWNNSGSNPSINWNPQHLACVLYSHPVSGSTYIFGSSTNLKTSPSNTIYNTAIVRAANDAVNITNISAVDSKRLYLNTQNIVPYTSPSGYNYIIYAYCYPGKTKQLYLGYTQYSIDSENHIHLMTKREFRDKSGNSFGNFTDCSRIISMDLKNGHLWITFIRGDSNGYYCFHIMAKDLVEE